MRWPFFALLLLGLPTGAMPQSIPQAPAPMRDVLSELSQRATALGKPRKDLRKYTQAIDYGASWLKERVTEKDPPEYRLQLTIDDYLLGRAIANPDDATEIVKSVAADVELKSRDCYQFGHGRRVSLEIRTMRGNVEEGGWQIFYRWLPPNNLPVQTMQMSFPEPSSPSKWDLPVGMYEFHIEKRDASGTLLKSNAMVVPVGLENKGEWRIQIP